MSEALNLEDDILDVVRSLVVVLDRDGRIVRFNRACEEATGYVAAEVLGRFVFDVFIRPEDAAAVRAVFADLTAGVFPNSHENHWRTKAGGERWIHWSNTARLGPDGQVRHVIGTGIDLTHNAALVEALGHAEGRFRDWVEALPDAAFIHRDGVILFVNAALRALVQEPTGGALAGAPVARLVAAGDLAEFLARAAYQEPRPASAAPRELRLLAADGSHVPVEIICMVMPFEGEAARVTLARDLRPRQAMTMRMFQVDRTVTLGSVAAGVGHEINNPLTFLKTNIEVALAMLGDVVGSPRLDESAGATVREVIEALTEAQVGAERIAIIVRDLKGLTRSADVEASSVMVEPLLDSLLQVAAHEFKHRAAVSRHYGEVPAVRGTEARLAQVFLNLLLNAAQAIQPGDVDRNGITLRTAVDGDQVMIEIADTGSGMAPEVLDRAFEPFFTTKEREGTGLGLAITRQIVISLGGSIEASSVEGRGSTFRVRLPRAAPEPASVEVAPASSPFTRRRVLLVDDELGVIRVLLRVLRPHHDVSAVGSGMEALAVLSADGPPPDVILCDVMMPAMTGIELYQTLVKRHPEIARRMVFMTGGSFTADSSDFLAAVGQPVIDKPFSAAAVLALIARGVGD